VDIICEEKADRLVELSYKIILLLARIRSSAEDIMTLVNLLDRHPDVDLREEI